MYKLKYAKIKFLKSKDNKMGLSGYISQFIVFTDTYVLYSPIFDFMVFNEEISILLIAPHSFCKDL